ncbi:MAG: c-type cytochrome, partial [Planctomycetaceae bacterium]
SWWRETAQRLLVEKQSMDAVESLQQLGRNGTAASTRLHALWTLHGLNALNEASILAALEDRDANVRRHAVALAEERLSTSKTLQNATLKMVADEDASVRFQLAFTLGACKPVPQAALIALIGRSREDSRVLLSALTSAGAAAGVIVQQCAAEHPELLRSPTESEMQFLEFAGEIIGAAGEPVEHTLRWIIESPKDNSASTKRLSPGAILLCAGIAERQSDELNRLPTGFHSAVVQSVREIALDDSAAVAVREAATRLLATLPADESVEILTALLKSSHTALQSAAARVVGSWKHSTSVIRVYEEWPQLPQTARRALLSASIGNDGNMLALLTAMERNLVLPVELPLAVDGALRSSNHAEVRQSAEKILGKAQSADRVAVITQLQDSLSLSGESSRGAKLFKQNCVTCHTVQGYGRKVGPDLSGIGARPPESLIVDLLDPSRQVSPDFLSFVAVLSDGRIQTGLLVSESATAVTLRPAEGDDITISRADIDELRATGKSLMPEGIEQKIDKQGLADLLAFLRAPDRNLLGSR